MANLVQFFADSLPLGLSFRRFLYRLLSKAVLGLNDAWRRRGSIAPEDILDLVGQPPVGSRAVGYGHRWRQRDRRVRVAVWNNGSAEDFAEFSRRICGVELLVKFFGQRGRRLVHDAIPNPGELTGLQLKTLFGVGVLEYGVSVLAAANQLGVTECASGLQNRNFGSRRRRLSGLIGENTALPILRGFGPLSFLLFADLPQVADERGF